jgi:hypothetical protein
VGPNSTFQTSPDVAFFVKTYDANGKGHEQLKKVKKRLFKYDS